MINGLLHVEARGCGADEVCEQAAGRYGIRVKSVSPGPVATPMLCQMTGKGAEEVERTFETSSCLNGALKVKHAVDAVVFLASDDSQFITGHNLVVDGGFKHH